MSTCLPWKSAERKDRAIDIYLYKGHGAVGDHDPGDIYAFFGSRAEELKFEGKFRGQDLRVTSQSIEFTPGIGAILWGCHIVEYKETKEC